MVEKNFIEHWSLKLCSSTFQRTHWNSKTHRSQQTVCTKLTVLHHGKSCKAWREEKYQGKVNCEWNCLFHERTVYGGSSLKDDLCLLKITGTQCFQLSPLYLTGSSQPIISTSPPSPSSPPIVMPRPCHKDCTFMWRKLRKMQRLKKAIDFL